jgi:exopolysaccharide biosynthesis WecB/TagA/CpsF family protein
MPIEGAASPATTAFLGLEFSRLSFEEVFEEILVRAAQDKFSYVVTPNVDHVVKLHPKIDEPMTRAFRDAYDAAALRLCDSRILARLALLFGARLHVVPGSDLTAALFARALGQGGRVAVIGGGADMIARLGKLLPGVDFAQHIPPMGMLSNPGAMQMAEEFVGRCQAKFVIFATGAPQSEILAHRCAQKGEARGVGLCVGASIEFLLGDQRRAPRWMQRAGLEWAHRLATNPRRLWRRYLVEGPKIFIIAARWQWGRRNNSQKPA